MISSHRAAIAAIFLGLPAGAAAEPYVALSLAQSHWKDACSGVESCDAKDTAGSVRGGYRFSPYFAAEARYFDAGKLKRILESERDIPGGDNVVHIAGNTNEYTLRGAGLGVVATLPVTDAFSVGATAGIARMRLNTRFIVTLNGTTDSGETKDDRTGYYYGLRASYAWTPESEVSLEAERYDARPTGGSLKVDTIGIAVTYRFR
jgi:hypothetical protein